VNKQQAATHDEGAKQNQVGKADNQNESNTQNSKPKQTKPKVADFFFRA
jgi:hypothetical protein